MRDRSAPSPSDERRRAIHAAAIDRFSEAGFAATSMADIADAAGMSRPALYQYFRNKEDVFASAFVHLFESQADAALAALDEPGDTASRLDAFLQRCEGDLWERTAASPHSDEILRAKSEEVSLAVDGVLTRLWDGMAAHLARVAPGRSRSAAARREAWIEVLRFSPKGFKFDRPTIDVYRRRLTALAQSVAADIDRS